MDVSALLQSVSDGDVEQVSALIKSGSDVNTADNDGKTILLHAVERNKEDIVRMLIAAGADVNVRDDNTGITPLSHAAKLNDTEIIYELIKAGADINICDNHGWTPLSCAVIYNSGEVVSALTAAGADLTIRDNRGRTPLSWAAACYRGEAVSALIAAGADVNMRDNSGRTPISWAAEYAIEEMVSELIVAGAAVSVFDNSGETPLSRNINNFNFISEYHTRRINVLPTVKCLIKHGADVNHEPFVRALCTLLTDNQLEEYRETAELKCDIFEFALEAGLRPQQWPAIQKLIIETYNNKAATDRFKQLINDLQRRLTCPSSLQHITKVAIRQYLAMVTQGRSIYHRVQSLPIPHVLVKTCGLVDL